MFKVIDSVGKEVRTFPTYKQASNFLINKTGWRILCNNIANYKRPTQKMLADLDFIEYILGIKFEGNRKDFYEVSDFLSEYLADAKYYALDLEGGAFSIY